MSVPAIIFSTHTLMAQVSGQEKIDRVHSLAQAVTKHGLAYSFYFNPVVDSQLQSLASAPSSALLDSKLNSIVTRIASDLSRGRVLPSKVQGKAYIKDKIFAYQLAANSFLNNAVTPDDFANSVAPKNYQYAEAKNVINLLTSYKVNNTWVVKPPTLVLGTVSRKTVNPPLITFLRQKLNSMGYANDVSLTTYAADLESAIKLFQDENQLQADGVVGSMSWKALDKNLDQLITQASLNLDRTRWLPDQSPSEYVYVNLARQTFQYFQNNNEVLSFKTVNGRLDRQTPMLVDMAKEIVLNPTWTVPRNLFVKDKLAKLRVDPGYIERNHMKLYSDINGREVDPYSVNWNLSPEQLPYTIVQNPGPWNALGFIKFPLTNPFAIYMHDTNERHLFNESMRLLSSGCMRLEKPFDVAEKLLANPQWSVEALKASSENLSTPAEKPSSLYLKKGVAVYAAYKTILINPAGRLISGNDPYEIDSVMYSLAIE